MNNKTFEMDGVILEDLYVIRRETFEDSVYERNNSLFAEVDRIGELLGEIIIKNDKTGKIIDELDKLQNEINEEQNFWNMCYYQKGIADAIIYPRTSFEKIDIEMFEGIVLKNSKEKIQTENVKKKLIDTVYKKIENEEIKNEITVEIDNLTNAAKRDKEIWRKECYQKGYNDIIQLKKECEKYKDFS